MTLRPALEADRDAITRVWIAGWLSTGIVLAEEPSYDRLRARVDEELAAGWRVTVAETAGAVVGFIALRPDQAKLDQIFIEPDRHGQGVGQALFAHARRMLPRTFTLWTHGDNIRARRFYGALSPLREEGGEHPKQGLLIHTYWFAGEAG